MRTRAGGRFFIIQCFMHIFSLLEVVTVLPFPKLSYNSFKAKRRGGLCARAQLGQCGPMAGSCGWVPGMKGLKGVGVGRMKSLIQPESQRAALSSRPRSQHSQSRASCHMLEKQ